VGVFSEGSVFDRRGCASLGRSDIFGVLSSCWKIRGVLSTSACPFQLLRCPTEGAIMALSGPDVLNAVPDSGIMPVNNASCPVGSSRGSPLSACRMKIPNTCLGRSLAILQSHPLAFSNQGQQLDPHTEHTAPNPVLQSHRSR
jgi:hypothetical protein